MERAAVPDSNAARMDLAGGSHLGACRASVTTLRRLLDSLFPDAQSPDILTVEDVIRRYPLTQLGAPAAAAMEQSRRITRIRRDFRLAGLCEFHCGLIFLYWGDSRAAAQQFAVARSQWSLAGEAAAGCLAHFAQGLALQHGYHYEAAMSQFGWAERTLTRTQIGAQAAQLATLGDELWPLLEAAQQDLRPKLWPEEQMPPSPTRSGTAHVAPPAAQAPEEPATASEAPSEPAAKSGPAVPMPISNLSLEHPTTASAPVPGHAPTDERYAWYVVHKRNDGLMPDVTEGTWVLVDSEPGPWVNGGAQEMIVIGGQRPNMGSVLVRPRTAFIHQPYCYLGFRAAEIAGADGNGAQKLIMDDSGHALAIPDALVMGTVVGFWHNVIA